MITALLNRSRLSVGFGFVCIFLGGSVAAVPSANLAVMDAAPSGVAAPTHVNFSHDIAPIMYSNCMTCHRAGEVGPFPLASYSDVKKKARTILKVVDSGRMPPWHADSHGEFTNERKLTPLDKALIHAWYDEGEPEGNPADLPPAPHFVQGWQLGAPDLVLDAGADFAVPAEGADIYRCFVMPTHEATDKWVAAVEIRPGSAKVVHHALIYIDTTGAARKLDAQDPGLGYRSFGGVGFSPQGGLGGWAPGIVPLPLPDGVGYFLPKGADIVLQIHYHLDGKAESDRTRLGLFFCTKPVDKRYRSFPLSYRQLKIPAGDADYEVNRTFPASPGSITVLSVTPHMHLLGRQIKLTAVLPDGSPLTFVNVPDWDFNWQTIYRYRTPIKVPRGSLITLSAKYDNSPANPANPNVTPKEVHWGEQTTDEMCIAFLGYTRDSEHLLKSGGSGE